MTVSSMAVVESGLICSFRGRGNLPVDRNYFSLKWAATAAVLERQISVELSCKTLVLGILNKGKAWLCSFANVHRVGDKRQGERSIVFLRLFLFLRFTKITFKSHSTTRNSNRLVSRICIMRTKLLTLSFSTGNGHNLRESSGQNNYGVFTLAGIFLGGARNCNFPRKYEHPCKLSHKCHWLRVCVLCGKTGDQPSLDFLTAEKCPQVWIPPQARMTVFYRSGRFSSGMCFVVFSLPV